MAKTKSEMKGGYRCDCGVCDSCSLLIAIVLLLIVLVPGWYILPWAKWVIIISAIFLLVKRWCPCNWK